MTKTYNKRSALIVAIVAAVILAVRFSSMFLPQSTGTVDPHINLSENQAQILEKQRQQQIATFVSVTEGEVSRTEERIREATALATVVSLYVANQSINRRTPATVITVLSGVNDAHLMPPGMQVSGSAGEVTSVHAKLFVRYRPEPPGVEVVSLGKAKLDGPALLIRVPGGTSTGEEHEAAALYVATSLDQIRVPAAFANEAEMAALGFAPEPLRAAKLPKP